VTVLKMHVCINEITTMKKYSFESICLCGTKNSNTLTIDIIFNKHLLTKYFFQAARSIEYAKLIK